MKHMVIGSAFHESLESIVMIKKNRPDFLAGLFNFVGGHVESNETSPEAMVREFKEETSADVPLQAWIYIGTKTDNKTYILDYYTCYLHQELWSQVKTNTDESISKLKLVELPHKDEMVYDAQEVINLSLSILKKQAQEG